MQPLENNRMSDFLNEANSVLQHMKNQNERAETLNKIHAENLKMYKETIDKSIEMSDKRMDANDARFTSLRNSLIGSVIFVTGLVVSGGVVVNTKVGSDDLEKLDYASKTEVIRGDQYVIEGILDFVEDETDADPIDTYNYQNNMSSGVYKEVTGEVTRNIK